MLTTVQKQQLLLAYLGYDVGTDNNGNPLIDGISGVKTEAALKQFKDEYGADADGLVGAIAGTVAKKRKPPDTVTDTNVGNKTGTFWDNIKYFTRSEFACHCGGTYCNGFPVEPDESLVKALDNIREHFGKPITVSSGIRCTQHNANVGGVSNSQHLYGTAADIIVSGVSPSKIADYAENILPNGGVGRYGSFTHVDTRGVKARWNG